MLHCPISKVKTNIVVRKTASNLITLHIIVIVVNIFLNYIFYISLITDLIKTLKHYLHRQFIILILKIDYYWVVIAINYSDAGWKLFGEMLIFNEF